MRRLFALIGCLCAFTLARADDFPLPPLAPIDADTAAHVAQKSCPASAAPGTGDPLTTGCGKNSASRTGS